MIDPIKVLVYDVIVRAAIKRLFTLVPLFGWGPIGVFVTSMIFKFTDLAYEIGTEYVYTGMFRFQNKEHQEAFDKETIKLLILEKDKYANQEDVDEAIKLAQDRMSDFVVYAPQLRPNGRFS